MSNVSYWELLLLLLHRHIKKTFPLYSLLLSQFFFTSSFSFIIISTQLFCCCYFFAPFRYPRALLARNKKIPSQFDQIWILNFSWLLCWLANSVNLIKKSNFIFLLVKILLNFKHFLKNHPLVHYSCCAVVNLHFCIIAHHIFSSQIHQRMLQYRKRWLM